MRYTSLLLLAACQLEEPSPELAETRAEVTILASYQVAGQTLVVEDLGSMHFMTTRIASCGQGVLYATRTSSTTENPLYFTPKAGVSPWALVNWPSIGPRIACDRRHLYSLGQSGNIYHANTTAHGDLAETNGTAWTGVGLAPAGTTEIQSGMGNIYALAYNATTHVSTLRASQLKNSMSPAGYVQGSPTSWDVLASNLGASRATGAGALANYTPYTSSLPYRKQNRAFGANPDSSLYYNDTMLEHQNGWTWFPNAGLSIADITADDSSTLYALVTDGLAKRLVRFRFTESNCTDGLDNDANGQIDAEDAVCRQKLATSWCATHTGSYCIDRIQNTNGYSEALVSCRGTATVTPGVCVKSLQPGNDSLMREPRTSFPDEGHYCSVIHSDGTWDFEETGPEPCETLKAANATAEIVRAGIYSTTKTNTVYVRCNNGGYVTQGTGAAPLVEAYNAVGHTANRCVFTVSPKEMRVFNAPFPTSAWNTPLLGGRGYVVGHRFDHAPPCMANDPGCPCVGPDCAIQLAQFGNGESGSTNWLSNLGKAITGYQKDQSAYDYIINEGVPMRSLGWGKVIGARERPIGWMSNGADCSDGAICGTPHQGEIYVQHSVGNDPTYAETFVAYYGHVKSMVVTEGQVVRPGQLLGYSGTTGASSDPHVHFAVVRITNTNGRTVADGEAFGYRVPFVANNDWPGNNPEALHGTIDPYGWRAPAGIDPYGHTWGNAASFNGVQGVGAWSPSLWSLAETPPYTTP